MMNYRKALKRPKELPEGIHRASLVRTDSLVWANAYPYRIC